MSFIVSGDIRVDECPKCKSKKLYLHSMSGGQGKVSADIQCLSCGHRKVFDNRTKEIENG